MLLKVDKRSPIPRYYQLAELIREQVRRGVYRVGEQLPSVQELADQAGISRMTARQAVELLVRDGTLVVRHGAGTFVAESKLVSDAIHLLGFTESMAQRGITITSRVLDQSLVIPTRTVAEGLRLGPSETVVQIRRLRLVGTTPLLLETSSIPSRLCPGLETEDLANQSLYAMLAERYGIHLQRTHHTLEAVLPDTNEYQWFGHELRTPVIVQEGIAYLEDDMPAEYFHAVYRGDRFKFELESKRVSSADEGPGSAHLSLVLATIS
jgi:GntR family transcriptional regulator